ncbi:MAG: lanthionine synthetase LanC family protein [Clostridium fessum]
MTKYACTQVLRALSVFLLSLYEDTQDAAYLDEAREAGCYLEYRWRKRRELKRNFSPYAFSTGWGGASFALLQMYLVTKDEHYRALVEEILDQAVRDAIPVKKGEGYYWSTYPGIVGTAGTILVILNAAEKLGREDWKEFAVKAGRYFLTRGRDMGNGMICYTGVDPTYFGAGKDYIDPNFPMGTGGIGISDAEALRSQRKEGISGCGQGRAGVYGHGGSQDARWKIASACAPGSSGSLYSATATDRQEPTVSTMSRTNSAAM